MRKLIGTELWSWQATTNHRGVVEVEGYFRAEPQSACDDEEEIELQLPTSGVARGRCTAGHRAGWWKFSGVMIR